MVSTDFRRLQNPMEAKVLPILFWPDPRLKRLSKPVTEFNADLKTLAQDMLATMRSADGVGLAAPQVGVNLRLFVMNSTGEPGDDRIYANPSLSEPDGAEDGEEGCLSLPDIRIPVGRSARLTLCAQDVHGNPLEEAAEGFPVRVWQHEIDHLDGITLVDKMSPSMRMAFNKKLKQLQADFSKKK